MRPFRYPEHAFAGGLIRVRIRGDQATKADQWDMGARIRAVDQGPKGEVYLLEDGDSARLLKLAPAR